jgi:hypothetical protein
LRSQTDPDAIVDEALEHQSWFASEFDNAIVESQLIANSGADPSAAFDKWAASHLERSEIAKKSLFQVETPNPWITKPRPPPAIAEMVPFLSGERLPRRALVLRVRQSFPRMSVQEVADIVMAIEEMRAALHREALGNPFRRFAGIARQLIPASKRETCERFDPEKCQYCFRELIRGNDFISICEVIDAGVIDFEENEES